MQTLSSVVVHCSSLFGISKLFKFLVACCKSLSRQVSLTVLLSESGQVTVKDFSGATALLLTDVVVVRPSCHKHAEEEQGQVPISMVVESVWSVPVGECPCVLVGQGSRVTYLLVTLSANQKKSSMLTQTIFNYLWG